MDPITHRVMVHFHPEAIPKSRWSWSAYRVSVVNGVEILRYLDQGWEAGYMEAVRAAGLYLEIDLSS